MRHQNGVTLVEVLVVIAIVSVLAAIVIYAAGIEDGGVDREQACYDRGGQWFDGGRFPTRAGCITNGPNR